MSPKPTSLLKGYLEKVSWKVLDEYPKLVQEMIRNQSGVYALYKQDKLYYVGLAGNLMGRLKGHLKDRHRNAWDRFSVYLTKDAPTTKQLESLLLRIAKPPGNRVSGGFGGAANLYRALNQIMRRTDADRRARLIGGWVAKHRRAKAAAKNGSLGLAGLVDRPIALRSTWKKKSYRARVLRNGQISFSGERYDSPSAAARAASGSGVNGWGFWKYQVKRGKWVPLSKIRARRAGK